MKVEVGVARTETGSAIFSTLPPTRPRRRDFELFVTLLPRPCMKLADPRCPLNLYETNITWMRQIGC